ncbi:MAG: DUF2783 domain-containing protein [Gammaproteobacteria bacterium]|nr:DUF2783 domain-containing protein [Gammaproteobacteria bacterium]
MAREKALNLQGLESVYDSLAEAIDEVGETATPLFLVKLVLLLADTLGDEQDFKDLLARARTDLPQTG